MSLSSDVKRQFLSNFQTKIIQGRKLLQTGNHRWADKLFTDLYFEIQKKEEWLDLQKKRQLILIISNSWWIYLNSLTRRKEEETKIDIIKYIDAYNRFFLFLYRLDDFYLFNSFTTTLLKSFIKMENLSVEGITKFINSLSIRIKERGNNLKIIELQIVLMFLRKSVMPSDFYHYAMQLLGKTLFTIEPSKRALFLYVFLENININYQLKENAQDFVQEINKILANRLPAYLKNEFTQLSRISINERNLSSILSDLEGLIYYLNYIGEQNWIIVIVRNLFTKIKEFQSIGDAITFVRKFIEFSISRNRFEIAFEIYDFLEDLFVYQTDLGYDNVLIELWVEACKKFVEMKEKKYLLQSLEKLNNHLKTPQTLAQVFHFFYTCNYLWQLKSQFFSLEANDFWRMIFYRALFEENDYELAEKISPYLDKNIQSQLTDLKALYEEAQALKSQIYGFKDNVDISGPYDPNFVIKQMILRINSKGEISYRMISLENKIIEGRITDEYWNDAHIIDVYYDLFSDKQEKQYKFNLNEFGKIIFLFLPKLVRAFLRQFKITSLNVVPEIYFILDNMTIPFELIYENNFFLLKYSSAYKIGESPIEGVAFDQTIVEQLIIPPTKKKYNVLVIDSINSQGPFKWNEQTKNQELIFSFAGGKEEINFITDFFNNREEVNQINLLSESNSTRENILLNLSQGMYHIVHFVGNIFYSKWNPKDSFFLTNDNNIITFNEIRRCLIQNPSNIQPFLFFNVQIFDVDGEKIKNTLKYFGEIVAQFNYNKIIGIISRNYPIFNKETKEIVANFYVNLLKNRSQGVGLLKARQECMARKTVEIAEQKFKNLAAEEGIKNISLENSYSISSYILFGMPWKRLS